MDVATVLSLLYAVLAMFLPAVTSKYALLVARSGSAPLSQRDGCATPLSSF